MSGPSSAAARSLQPGVRLGPYELVARIGAGGMGEVWRASDTRLERSVGRRRIVNWPSLLERTAKP